MIAVVGEGLVDAVVGEGAFGCIPAAVHSIDVDTDVRPRFSSSRLSPALTWAAATGAAQCTRPLAWGPTTADVISVVQVAADEAA